MTTFVLIPGAGSTPWYWHLVVPELRARGHETVTPTLPTTDPSADFTDYADAVIEAIGERRSDLVLVAQSMAGFTAPLVADRIPVKLIVMVAAMIPAPGESAGEWWDNTGQPQARREFNERNGLPDDGEFDPYVTFLHDVPPEVAAESGDHVTEQAAGVFAKPWPLAAWPDVPTRVLLCRDDRFFPAEFQRRVTAERLGIVPDEMPGGHLPALHSPKELATRLDAYQREVLG
jgi:pimeloyl-ACP methyl ester carboxylesterase